MTDRHWTVETIEPFVSHTVAAFGTSCVCMMSCLVFGWFFFLLFVFLSCRVSVLLTRVTGTDRCMFASNFPVDKLMSTYDKLFDAYGTIVETLPAREKVLVWRAIRPLLPCVVLPAVRKLVSF
jgi:predicted TIM-barrel fold metal-dependent hydrolase